MLNKPVRVIRYRIPKGLLRARAFLIAAILAATRLLAAQEAKVPQDGESLIPPKGIEAFRPGGKAGPDVEASIVAVKEKEFPKALRIKVKRRPDVDYDMQAGVKTVRAVRKGDLALAIVTGRAIETGPGSSEAIATFVFERSGPDYAKSVSRMMRFGKEWKTYYIPFSIREDYAAGGAQCNLKYGYDPQTLELGGVRVLNFKRSLTLEALPRTATEISYQGREPDAAWRKAADERIEKYRKGDLSLRVMDAKGKPVPDAEVSVDMRRHAYHFGAAVTARLLTADTDDGRRYRAIVEENFNKVVFENDLKIGPWERGKRTTRTDNFNMANTMDALAWCAERGILVRGHTLLWGPLDKKFYPKELGFDIDGGDWARMGKLLLAHMDEKAAATKSFVSEWDVINHPVAVWGDKGRCWDTVLGRNFYVDSLRRARELNPGQLLYVNEGSDFPGREESVRAAYEKLIGDLMAAGAPLDGIGFMSHFDENSLSGMDDVWAHLERYARFGLRLQSTELDVASGGDELGQADYYRDFMTMLFSHPSTVGIVMWGFWEKSHWEPDRALYRANWELKPCGKAWLDLVKGAWWTNASGRTDLSGSYSVRGFYGDYEIVVKTAGKETTKRVSFTESGLIETIVIP